MNIQGLLIQKPETPAPEAGRLQRFTWFNTTGKSGNSYTKVKRAKDGEGSECEIISAHKTDYTDSYGNVSFNVEFKPLETQQAAARPPTNGKTWMRQADPDRSARIERQHSQEMALRYFNVTNKGGELDTNKLREMISWFQRDISRSPEKTAPVQPEPEPCVLTEPTMDDEPPSQDEF
jgi:hypothetical protein